MPSPSNPPPQPDAPADSAVPTPESRAEFDANSFSSSRPYHVLGLEAYADAEEVRKRYLDLVRQYPPERDPVMFAKIRYAYESASNPIVFAHRLLELSRAEPRAWEEILADHDARPPRIPTELLLSLGNRRRIAAADTSETNESES